MTDVSPVQVVRNIRIPLSDGAELAADLYAKEGTAGQPAPAIVCIWPYRKDDFIATNFAQVLERFAAAGYACLMVDVRGTGSSEGPLHEAMSEQDGIDAAEVIEWVAEEAWCSGAVGMWGMSYGGIVTFQAASRRPAPLKAIVSLMGSADVYSDLFYPGGTRNMLDIAGWGSMMLAMQLAPPMTRDDDERWEKVWADRTMAEPWLTTIHGRELRDEFWDTKSTDLSSIDVPAFLVAGWDDMFLGPMVRATSEVQGPMKAWIGPWMHVAPHLSPTHGSDWIAEALRWWDRWLRDIPNGVDEGPAVTAFCQGRDYWHEESVWPPADVEHAEYFALGTGDLATSAEPGSQILNYATSPSVGVASGSALVTVPAADQRPDDARSLTFLGSTAPIAFQIVGAPAVTVHLTADFDLTLVARLCDVAPDGSSRLITKGSLRLPDGCREGSVDLHLQSVSYLVEPGHALQLALACADFPLVWPSRRNGELQVRVGAESPTRISVPVVAPREPVAPPPTPDLTINPVPLMVDPQPTSWQVEEVDGTTTVTVRQLLKGLRSDDSGHFEFDQTTRVGVPESSPELAWAECASTFTTTTADGECAVTTVQVHLGQDDYELSGHVTVNGSIAVERNWSADASA